MKLKLFLKYFLIFFCINLFIFKNNLLADINEMEINTLFEKYGIKEEYIANRILKECFNYVGKENFKEDQKDKNKIIISKKNKKIFMKCLNRNIETGLQNNFNRSAPYKAPKIKVYDINKESKEKEKTRKQNSSIEMKNFLKDKEEYKIFFKQLKSLKPTIFGISLYSNFENNDYLQILSEEEQEKYFEKFPQSFFSRKLNLKYNDYNTNYAFINPKKFKSNFFDIYVVFYSPNKNSENKNANNTNLITGIAAKLKKNYTKRSESEICTKDMNIVLKEIVKNFDKSFPNYLKENKIIKKNQIFYGKPQIYYPLNFKKLKQIGFEVQGECFYFNDSPYSHNNIVSKYFDEWQGWLLLQDMSNIYYDK